MTSALLGSVGLVAAVLAGIPAGTRIPNGWTDDQQAKLHRSCAEGFSTKLTLEEAQNACTCAVGLTVTLVDATRFTRATDDERNRTFAEQVGRCGWAISTLERPLSPTHAEWRQLRRAAAWSEPSPDLNGWSFAQIYGTISDCEHSAKNSRLTARTVEKYCYCMSHWLRERYSPARAETAVALAAAPSGESQDRYEVLGMMAACRYASEPSPGKSWWLRPSESRQK